MYAPHTTHPWYPPLTSFLIWNGFTFQKLCPWKQRFKNLHPAYKQKRGGPCQSRAESRGPGQVRLIGAPSSGLDGPPIAGPMVSKGVPHFPRFWGAAPLREAAVLSWHHQLCTISPSASTVGEGALEAQFGGRSNSVAGWDLTAKGQDTFSLFCWIGHTEWLKPKESG